MAGRVPQPVFGNTRFQLETCPAKETLYLKDLYYTFVQDDTLVLTPKHNLPISVIRHSPPADFHSCGSSASSLLCICDFPGQGCCHTGRTDSVESPCLAALQRGHRQHWGCRWCGEKGCCRATNCGHPCCEAITILSDTSPCS